MASFTKLLSIASNNLQMGYRIFGSVHLPNDTKAHLAAACVSPRILHGSGMWTGLNAKQDRKIECALLQPL